MGKGVKKITMFKGQYYKQKSSSLTTRVTIKPDQWVSFKVAEWLPDTTEEEKKEDIYWIRQSQDRKTIYYKAKHPNYKLKIPKKECGNFSYYIEGSRSGNQDFKNPAGVYVSGYTPKRIISTKWAKTEGGTSIKNKNDTNYIKYGNSICLQASTEGLNGYEDIVVEVYNQQLGADKMIWTYNAVKCVDGEINLKIQNTSQWMPRVRNIQDVEQFYVKIKHKGTYIIDNLNDDKHAIYLNIKEEEVASTPQAPQNITPTKVHKLQVNASRHEPCKFTEIQVIENGEEAFSAFKEGQKLEDKNYIKQKIHRTVFFDFNDHSINGESQKKLNNILGFLLAHPGSAIDMNGYACVIGEQNYNKDLSQKRSDAVKNFFAQGKLDATRIISVGKGEYNTGDKDNIVHKNEKDYILARRVDISFTFNAHDAKALVYETVAPSSPKPISVSVINFEVDDCYRASDDKHKKGMIIHSPDGPKQEKQGDYAEFSIQSTLSKYNPAPLQYIWPKWNLINGATGNGINSAALYRLIINSCRYYSLKDEATVIVKAYPDIKWTLEFKWNHTQPFVYSFGNKLHPHDIKTGKKKVMGSEIDRGWSKNFGEMEQSFELSLEAEWNEKSQKAEIGKEFGEKIAKTLSLFNKIKSMTERVSNSPLTKGKVMFEIKSPVIAFSAQWYLERGIDTSLDVSTMVIIGVSAKPLVEASFTINLFKIFVETAGNGLCPGAGTIITWVMDKLESNVGIHFLVIFAGGIYVDGKVTINTSYPKETTGEVKATGKIQVTVEFKAWGKAGSANIGVDGVIKADVSTSVTGGVKVGADKKGIYGCPVAEFGGIKATFVAAATVKFGIFKRTFSYEDEAILVEDDEIKFDKNYIN